MTRVAEALSLGGEEEGCWHGEGVSVVGGVMPQPKHPAGNKLVCWGCALWVGKCWVAELDSRLC